MSVLLILLLIALLLYGGDRLGALGKGLGKGVKTFKKSLRDEAQPPPKTVRVETLEARPLPESSQPNSEKPPPDEETH